jgi:hypothetical protein
VQRNSLVTNRAPEKKQYSKSLSETRDIRTYGLRSEMYAKGKCVIDIVPDPYDFFYASRSSNPYPDITDPDPNTTHLPAIVNKYNLLKHHTTEKTFLKGNLKGAVSRDFRTMVFFHQTSPPRPLVYIYTLK